jgi:hypothetical protein
MASLEQVSQESTPITHVYLDQELRIYRENHFGFSPD